jgi:hypothetical protein
VIEIILAILAGIVALFIFFLPMLVVPVVFVCEIWDLLQRGHDHRQAEREAEQDEQLTY